MFKRKYRVWEPDIKVGDKVVMFRKERFFGMNDRMEEWLEKGEVLEVKRKKDSGDLYEDGYSEIVLECGPAGRYVSWSLHPTHVMKVGDANE